MVSGAHTTLGALRPSLRAAGAAGGGLAEQVTPAQIPRGKLLPLSSPALPALGFAAVPQSKALTAALSCRHQMKCHGAHFRGCAHLVHPVLYKYQFIIGK